MSHFYFSTKEQANRLFKEWRQHRKIVIAYDYDNTVFDYHGEGHDYSVLIKLLRQCRDFGAHFVVFTAAEPERHQGIRQFLDANDIPVDIINENVPSVPFKLTGMGQKIYYNILLDDRAGLGQAFDVLKTTLERMKTQLILDTNYFQRNPNELARARAGAGVLEEAMNKYYDLGRNQYPPRPRHTHTRPYPVVPNQITFDKNDVPIMIHHYPIHSYVSLKPELFAIYYNFFKSANMLHLLPKEHHKNLFRVSASQNGLRFKNTRPDTISLDLPLTFQFFRSASLKEIQYTFFNRHFDMLGHVQKLLRTLLSRALPLSRVNFVSFSNTKDSYLMNVSLNLIEESTMQVETVSIPRKML